ncbi:MAG TPA: type II toxin-antitoxin system VapC family toxin [Candidatus Binatus sp.]|nr:type II toxin-antitoxin system VapC family toxin [Candidatus Binatus sp.]
MLDSDVCIDVMRGRSHSVRSRLERMSPEEVAISSVVAAELWTGVLKSREPERSRIALNAFLVYVAVLDWPAEAATTYGQIRAELEHSGKSIGAMDLLIAAHAIHETATLITRNQSEFRRVDGLKLETWN